MGTTQMARRVRSDGVLSQAVKYSKMKRAEQLWKAPQEVHLILVDEDAARVGSDQETENQQTRFHQGL